MENNRLLVLSRDAFRPLRNLIFLNLSGNKLYWISPDGKSQEIENVFYNFFLVFWSTPVLSKLYLNFTAIEYLTSDHFANIEKSLTELSLADTNFHRSPLSALKKCSQLKNLNLTRFRSKTEWVLPEFRKLGKLDLTDTKMGNFSSLASQEMSNIKKMSYGPCAVIF